MCTDMGACRDKNLPAFFYRIFRPIVNKINNDYETNHIDASLASYFDDLTAGVSSATDLIKAMRALLEMCVFYNINLSMPKLGSIGLASFLREVNE